MSLYTRIVLDEAKISIGMGRLTKTFKQVVSDLGGKTWIVFDTETTGFKPTATTMITELAAVAIDIDSGKKVGEYHAKAKLTKAVKELLRKQASGDKPKKGMTVADIFKMTRYGDKNAPFKPLKDVVTGFVDFVKKHQNPILVAHNAKFDMMQVNVALKKLGEKPLPRVKVYDTVSMARIYVYPLARALQKSGNERAQKMVDAFFSGGKFSARLENLGKVFDVKADHWHSGISDTLQLARILWKMVAFFKRHSSLEGEELLNQFMRKEAAREWSRQWYFKAGKQWREKRGMS
jgi:DNA polymerase III epsilon subunit-like protein